VLEMEEINPDFKNIFVALVRPVSTSTPRLGDSPPIPPHRLRLVSVCYHYFQKHGKWKKHCHAKAGIGTNSTK
jgi:hypothetical protein